jgi:tRNA threonylcarbamoyl adenosine modification protein YeaZ
VTGILALDTASPTGMALAFRPDGGDTRVARLDGGRDHSRQLLAAIEALVGLQKHDIRAIGVVTGPGSYAGLRVGIATAESLGLGLDVPVFGATTFEAALAALDIQAGLLIHPAGRQEFAVQRVVDGRLKGVPWPLPADSLPGDALAGEGASAFGGHEITPGERVRALAGLVERRLAKVERPPGIEAYYLREPNVTRPKRTPLVAH